MGWVCVGGEGAGRKGLVVMAATDFEAEAVGVLRLCDVPMA